MYDMNMYYCSYDHICTYEYEYSIICNTRMMIHSYAC